MTANLPWIEKYRPSNLNELISQDDIVHTLQKFISNGNLPHLLFYGPPGTGKTSTILAIAKQIYPQDKTLGMFVLEMNSSDDRGIGVVRNEILNFASAKSLYDNKLKLIILDEADAMTKDAQNALRRIIEKYTETARFCLICNYQSKIIPAIQSRCTKFRFSPLKISQIRPRLDYIISEENVKATEDGIDALMKLSSGDMRQVINILQSTSMAFDEVNEETVYACIGQPLPKDMKHIMNILLNENIVTAMKLLSNFRLNRGYALQDVVTQLHILLLKVDFPDEVQMDLAIKLADIEKRLSIGSSDKIQSGSLVAAFFLIRDKVASPVQ